MKLIIDVPEKVYQNAREDMLSGSELITNAIKNGTPIEQEPCGDCISRQALLEEIENGIKAGNYEEGYEEYPHINDMDDIVECIKYADKVQPKADAWSIKEVANALEKLGFIEKEPQADSDYIGNFKAYSKIICELPSVNPQEPKIEGVRGDIPIQPTVPKMPKIDSDCISRQAVIEITAETGALETQVRVKALPPVTPQEPKAFAEWVAKEIFSDEWELNKDAFAEVACRKLAKLGIVEESGDNWALKDSEG